MLDVGVGYQPRVAVEKQGYLGDKGKERDGLG